MDDKLQAYIDAVKRWHESRPTTWVTEEQLWKEVRQKLDEVQKEEVPCDA